MYSRWILKDFRMRNHWVLSLLRDRKKALFWRSPKNAKSFKNNFFRMFCVLFTSKWCAALSSVVCLGGPEGQVAGFNANVWFENISGPDVYILKTYLRNEYLQQNLNNMKLQKNVFKMYFERFWHANFLGFGPALGLQKGTFLAKSKNSKIIWKLFVRDVLCAFY